MFRTAHGSARALYASSFFDQREHSYKQHIHTSEPKLCPSSCVTVIKEALRGILKLAFRKVTTPLLKFISPSLESSIRTLLEHIPPISVAPTQARPRLPLGNFR